MRRLLWIGLLQFLVLGCTTVATSAPKPGGQAELFMKPKATKLVLVVLENTTPGAIESQKDNQSSPLKFLRTLAKEGASLSDYHAIAHPSQPNYVAIISGSFAGVSGDSAVTLDREHLGNRLTAKGLSWKVYAQGGARACELHERDGAI